METPEELRARFGHRMPDTGAEAELMILYVNSLRHELNATMTSWAERHYERPQATTVVVLYAIQGFLERTLRLLDTGQKDGPRRLPPFFEPWVEMLRIALSDPLGPLTDRHLAAVDRLAESLGYRRRDGTV
jgi:hypothetical protein